MISSKPLCKQNTNGSTQIKIVHLLDSLDHGGAAQVLVDMVVGLDKTKYAPLVCLTRPTINSPRVQELIKHNIPLITLERKHRFDFGAWKPLWNVLSDTAILHAHSETSNMWARLFGAMKRVPIILTQEHKAPDKKRRVFRIIDRVLGPLSTRIITVSEFDKERLIAYENQKPTRVKVLHNGIAPERFDLPLSKLEARTQAGVPQEGLLFVMIGRLDDQKKHEFFLEAFVRLQAQAGQTMHAMIAGSGSRLDELKGMAKRLGLTKQVLFLGQRSDIPLLLKAANAMVLTSVWECLPLVVLEALAAKCPVVATDVGGVSEALKEGEAGTVIPYGDVSALVDALQFLLDHPDQIESKVEVGYEWVNSYFCKARMVAELEALYQTLSEEHAPQGDD